MLDVNMARLAVFRLRNLQEAVAAKAGLKKLFNLMSLKLHPDKNPGDELAKEAFQHLTAAHDNLRTLLQIV
jgi:hypothetical protein